MVVSDTINTRVQATIKGARIVSENVTSDGAYEVTMEIPMFGESGGLAEAVFERRFGGLLCKIVVRFVFCDVVKHT